MTILQPSLSEPAGLSAAVPDVHLQPVMGFMSFQKPSKTRRLEKKVPKHFSPLCLLSLNLWAFGPPVRLGDNFQGSPDVCLEKNQMTYFSQGNGFYIILALPII